MTYTGPIPKPDKELHDNDIALRVCRNQGCLDDGVYYGHMGPQGKCYRCRRGQDMFPQKKGEKA